MPSLFTRFRETPSENASGLQPQPKPFLAASVAASFHYAWQGLLFVYDTERNFRIHLIIATVALAMGIILKISMLEWILVWALIGFVLCAELANTAIEHLVDLITDGTFHPRAKWVKDIMAAAVMVAALTSATCGALIFLPHILN
jgi:diacylglycerol kinase (ATP)